MQGSGSITDDQASYASSPLLKQEQQYVHQEQYEYQNQDPHENNLADGEPNPTEIVRSIASYLSLSEVESIGSLYSLVSPQAMASTSGTAQHGNGHGHGHGLGHGFAAYRGTPKNPWKNSHGHGLGHGYYGSSSYMRMSPLASIDDDVRVDIDTSLNNNRDIPKDGKLSAHSSTSGSGQNTSGPDAAAGLGPGCASIENLTQAYGYDEDSKAPELRALSPVPLYGESECESDDDDRNDVSSTSCAVPQHEYTNGKSEDVLQREHLKKIQENLKDAVFQVPQSIRSYCLQSHRAAAKLRRLRRKEISSHLGRTIEDNSSIRNHRIGSFDGSISYTPDSSPGSVYDYGYEYEYGYGFSFQDQGKNHHDPPFERIIHLLTSSIFQNVPLSILFDVTYQSFDTSVKVTHASASLTVSSTAAIIHTLISSIHRLLETIARTLNPMSLLNNILQLQRNAVGKTSESILTGIHSVAHGVGSASTSAFHMAFSNSKSDQGNHGNHGANVSGSPMSGMASVRTSLVGGLFQSGGNTRETVISEKMFHKLSKVGPASKVVKYIERDDEVLTKHAKKRIQRIMHYSVPLRPFMATVEVVQTKSSSSRRRRSDGRSSLSGLFGDVDFPSTTSISDSIYSPNQCGIASVSDESGRCSPISLGAASSFMSTPKSFPPTPTSRAHVLARGTRFAEDVVFLARDQLRVEKSMNSEHAQTRAMARALNKGKRLAVFNASDVGAGINLSCGQHCASKVGNDLYSTARGMIPVLRNSFVYFEMTVSTPPLLSMMLHHASLSIGLSTLEMPLNALVGAWKGSVGLCSTGQLLASSQWCAPMNPKTYGSKSTVGCLVYLDDDSAFETWDGVMVTANIAFNVDGNVIIPAPSVVSVPGGNDSKSPNPTPYEDGQYSPFLPIFVPREEEFFPTLTLHSSQTEVLCRFCAEDILATSRSAIGAPRGVTVYAVDGSVLFHDDEDDEDVSADLSQCSDEINTLDSLSQDEEENDDGINIDLSGQHPELGSNSLIM